MKYPDWLDQGIWADFKAYRKEIKRPMSEVAEKRALGMLERAFATPEQRHARIDMAMVNGWQGIVFPEDLKRAKPKADAPPQSGATERGRRACAHCGRSGSPVRSLGSTGKVICLGGCDAT